MTKGPGNLPNVLKPQIMCVREIIDHRSFCPHACKKIKFISPILPLPGHSHVYAYTWVAKLEVSHYTSQTIKIPWRKVFGCYNINGKCDWSKEEISFHFPNTWKSWKDRRMFTVTETSHRLALTQSLTLLLGYHKRLRQTRCVHLLTTGNTECLNVYYADTLKGGCQWKYQNRKQMISSMMHLLSVTNWQRCSKHCFEAKTCEPEAFSGCCFEFLWLDFGVPLHCSGALLLMLFCEKAVYMKNQILFDELWMSFWIHLSPVLQIISQNVPAHLRGVMTHFQLCYACEHVNMAAPGQW